MLTLDNNGRPCYVGSKGPSHPQRMLKQRANSVSAAVTSASLMSTPSNPSNSVLDSIASTNQVRSSLPTIVQSCPSSNNSSGVNLKLLTKENESQNVVQIEKLKSVVQGLQEENNMLKKCQLQPDENIRSIRRANYKVPNSMKEGWSQTDNIISEDSFSLIENENKALKLKSENSKLKLMIDSLRNEISVLSKPILEQQSEKDSIRQLLESENRSLSMQLQQFLDQNASKKQICCNITEQLKSSRNILSSLKNDLQTDMRSFELFLQDSGTLLIRNLGNRALQAHQTEHYLSVPKSPSTAKTPLKSPSKTHDSSSDASELQQNYFVLQQSFELSERTNQLLLQENEGMKKQLQQNQQWKKEMEAQLHKSQEDKMKQQNQHNAIVEKLKQEILENKKTMSLLEERLNQSTSQLESLQSTAIAPSSSSSSSSSSSLSSPQRSEDALSVSIREITTSQLSNEDYDLEEKLRSRLEAGLKTAQELHQLHVQEIDALKHCGHVKDLARIAQSREITLERDKLSSEIKYHRDIINVLTFSLNAAEKSLSESQPAVWKKMVEGRSKRLQMIESQAKERLKDIDQRSQETNAVSSQHLAGFQTKSQEKWKTISIEVQNRMNALKELLHFPS